MTASMVCFGSSPLSPPDAPTSPTAAPESSKPKLTWDLDLFQMRPPATIATTAAPPRAATMAATIALVAALPRLAVTGKLPSRPCSPSCINCHTPHHISPLSDAITSCSAPAKEEPRDRDDDGAVNPGSNLFVTGIHPRLTEDEVTRLFSKYGTVEKCQIMRDPHTKESRGFGFVKMITSEEADAAKEGLQGKEFEGRTLSIEKARRARPRTPTPGKYFGPPSKSPLSTTCIYIC